MIVIIYEVEVLLKKKILYHRTWQSLVAAGFVVSCLLLFAIFNANAAAIPTILSYQGRLTNASGSLLGGSGTTYYFKFSIWDAVSGGNKLWPSTDPTSYATTVREGVFNVNIGDTTNGYPDTLDYTFDRANIFLKVEVSANGSSFETLAPRQQISSAAFAQVAGIVNGSGLSNLGGGFVASASSTVVGNLNITGNATTSNATSTNLYISDNASTTNMFANILNAGTSILRSLLVNGSSTLQNFTASNSTTTNATTTNLAITGITSSLLKTSSTGSLVAAVAGTDYLSSMSFAWPFTKQTGNEQATSTVIEFVGGFLSSASSTLTDFQATNSTTTSATTTNFYASNRASTTELRANTSFLGYLTSVFSSFANLLVTGSSTLQNFTSQQATTTQATSTNLAVSSVASALLKTSAGGSIIAATAGTDYEASLTAGDGLTRTVNDFDCDTASSSVFGCLLSAEWTKFDNKVSTTSIDTIGEVETLWGISNIIIENDFDASSELLSLFDDETGTGSIVFSTLPIFQSFISNASSTVGGGTAATGLTIWGGATTTGSFLALGSTTLQNFTSQQATTTAATTTNLATTNFCLNGDCRSSFPAALTFAFPFTKLSTNEQATSTTLAFLNGFLSTSSSTLTNFTFSTATGTAATTTNLAISSLTANTLLAANGSGSLVSTTTIGNNQLQNSTISGIALGSNLANLTATDSSLTFSGTYTGATARTIGLNLTNANAWTALQTFTNASSTLFSSQYASTTILCLSGDCRTSFPAALTFAFPFTKFGSDQSTTSLMHFFGGLNSTASSTIGAGTTATGLTIFGGATSTGQLLVLSSSTLQTLTTAHATATKFAIQAATTDTDAQVFVAKDSNGYPLLELWDGGQMLLGGAGSPNNQVILDVDNNVTGKWFDDVNNHMYGILSIPVANITSGPTTKIFAGVWGSPEVGTTNTQDYTNTTASVVGIVGSTRIKPSSGTISNAAAIAAVNDTQTGGTVTNYYGLLVNNISRGTNNFGIYQAGGNDINYFAGYTGFGTTTPRWNLQSASSTAPQLTLSDGDDTHWTFRSQDRQLYIATSSDTSFATSTVAALSIDHDGITTVQGLRVMNTASSTSGAPGPNMLYADNIIKGWVTVHGSAAQIAASFNVSSITDGGTGIFTINWDRDFASANYGVASMAADTTDEGYCSITTMAAATLAISCVDDEGTQVDQHTWSVISVGRQ